MAGDRHAQSYRRLLEHENVRYLGAIPYEDLPGYLQALDILLLPRISSKASTSSNPLKLVEYLAVGKPIVVDGVPITSDLNRLVYTTNEKITFQDAFRNAMVEVRNPSKSRVRDRQAYALSRTWDERVNRALRSALPTYILSAGANE
ncbi:glycosyltransferase [Alicyclobacillus fastidiosus]|uniref:glycosyltransferase n=1 Tax=Alicyclobacillus fastidiosus TaxID=392011 RepID=UPI0034DD2F20